MLERDYQPKLIKKLRALFPGCIILKNDSSYLQGVPDLSIFYGNKWAFLEVKTSETFEVEPNQSYYVNALNKMSFAAFIYPSNEEMVLGDLQRAFKVRGHTRDSKRQ
jgi:hypothetical protein